MEKKLIQEAQALAIQEITGQAPAAAGPAAAGPAASAGQPKLANFPDREEMERATGMPKPQPTKRSPAKSTNGESATVYGTGSGPSKRAKTSDAHAALGEVFAEAEEDIIAICDQLDAELPKDSAGGDGPRRPPSRKVRRVFEKKARRVVRRQKPLQNLLGDILGVTTTAYMVKRLGEVLGPGLIAGAQLFAELDNVMTSLGTQMLLGLGRMAEGARAAERQVGGALLDAARGAAEGVRAADRHIDGALLNAIVYLRENYEVLKNTDGYQQLLRAAQEQPAVLQRLLENYGNSGADASGAKPSGAGPVGMAMWAGKNFLWLLFYIAIVTHMMAGVAQVSPDTFTAISDGAGGVILPVMEAGFNMGNSVVAVAQYARGAADVIGAYTPQFVRDTTRPYQSSWIPGNQPPPVDPRSASFAQAASNFYGNFAVTFSAVAQAYIVMNAGRAVTRSMYKRIFGHKRADDVVLRDAKGKTMGFLPPVRLQEDERAKIAEAVKEAGLSEEAVDAVAQQVMRTFEKRFQERLALTDTPGGRKELTYGNPDLD